MTGFFYVYVLESAVHDSFYVGLTEDLRERLQRHNAGEVPHPAKFRPWSIKSAIACRDRARALAFERYLKTASGRGLQVALESEGPCAISAGDRRFNAPRPEFGGMWNFTGVM